MDLSRVNQGVEAFLWRIGLRGPLPYYWALIPLGAGVLLLFIAELMAPFRTGYYPDRWSVCRVETDSLTPNRAYIQLHRYNCYNYSESIAYETSDYGATWYRSAHVFTGDPWTPSPSTLQNLAFAGDELQYNGQPVWSFSRRWFRQFFSPNGYSGSYYSVPNQNASSQGIVYVALGEYGVLIGPNPPDAPWGEWHISREGIVELIPQPLTITHPFLVLVIVGLALTVPPLPWFHAWLLGQVWRYAFPESEHDEAFHLGFLTAVEISVIAVAAIILWLSRVEIDFYHIVGLMTVITVGIGVSQALNLAQEMGLERRTTLKMAAATGVVSLIVPIGVATTPFGFGWPVIITLVTGFIIYRKILERYSGYMVIDLSRWQIDRVVMEMVALAAVAVVAFSALFLNLGPTFAGWTLFGVPLLSILTVGVYSVGRGQIFMPLKKSAHAPLPLLFNSGEWRGSLFWNSLYWMAVSLVLAGVVFFVQVGVYAWFVTLGQY